MSVAESKSETLKQRFQVSKREAVTGLVFADIMVAMSKQRKRASRCQGSKFECMRFAKKELSGEWRVWPTSHESRHWLIGAPERLSSGRVAGVALTTPFLAAPTLYPPVRLIKKKKGFPKLLFHSCVESTLINTNCEI